MFVPNTLTYVGVRCVIRRDLIFFGKKNVDSAAYSRKGSYAPALKCSHTTVYGTSVCESICSYVYTLVTLANPEIH